MTAEAPRSSSTTRRPRAVVVVSAALAVLLLLGVVGASASATTAAATTRRSRGGTFTAGRTRGGSWTSSSTPRDLHDVTDSRYHRYRRRQQQRQQQRILQGDNKEQDNNKKTAEPTVSPPPSASPTISPAPSASPSTRPSSTPTASPSDAPSSIPSASPTSPPTVSHAPTTSPQPTSVPFDKVQTTKSDGTTETVLSCPTSDLPNDKYLYPLVTNDVSFQYGAVLHSKVSTDTTNPAVQQLLTDMELLIQKNVAWRYMNCDYQTGFAYQGFYVHSVGTGYLDQAQAEVCDGGDSSSNSNNAGLAGGATQPDDSNTTTHCLTITTKIQLQLVLYPERRRNLALLSNADGLSTSSSTSSTASSSSTAPAAQWGLDGRVVQDLGNFLTALLRDPETWQLELPDVKSTQFMGFVNPSKGQQDSTGSNNPDGSSTSTANSSSQGSDVLAVLPWVAIVLAVLVLGAALFLVVRHRRNKKGPRADGSRKSNKKKKNSATDDSSEERNQQHHEQTYMEDSYSDIVAHATSRSRRAPFDFGDDSTYNDDDHHNNGVLRDGRRQRGGLTIPDESTVRSDLGYSIEPMDYTNIGPSNSFDSEWTDANRSLFNLDKLAPEIGGEDADDADSPSEDAAAVVGEAPTAEGGTESEQSPKPARLINASLAMRAPHVGSARNKAKASAPSSGRNLNNDNNENTVDL